MGEGIIGMAAARCHADPGRQPAPDGEVLDARCGARSRTEGVRPGREIPLPGPARRGEPGSRCRDGARPAGRRADGREHRRVAFTETDETPARRRRVVRRQRHRDRTGPGAERRVAQARGPLPRPCPSATHGDPSCGSSPSTAARSSTATTSSRASPAASCGRCSSSTTRTDGSSSRTRSPPRPLARAPGVPRQPRQPADPAEAPARRARRPDPNREDRPRPLPPRGRRRRPPRRSPHLTAPADRTGSHRPLLCGCELQVGARRCVPSRTCSHRPLFGGCELQVGERLRGCLRSGSCVQQAPGLLLRSRPRSTARCRRQAAEIGISNEATAARVRNGAWLEPIPGVLVVAAARRTWQQIHHPDAHPPWRRRGLALVRRSPSWP